MQRSGASRTHALSLCVALVVVVGGIALPRSVAAGISDVMRQRVAFEPNQGQTEEHVKFLARATSYTLFLTSGEAVLALRGARADHAVVRMKLVGAREASRIVGVDELSGKANYLAPAASTPSITGIPTFAGVKYVGVYPGIDVVYYGREGHIEYDFVLAPGADPGQIVLAFDGADRLAVNADGDLVVHTRAGEVRQLRPVIYQDVEGGRRLVPGSYVIKDGRHVGIRVGRMTPHGLS
jgi:hypothetical protein